MVKLGERRNHAARSFRELQADVLAKPFRHIGGRLGANLQSCRSRCMLRVLDVHRDKTKGFGWHCQIYAATLNWTD